MLIAETVGGGIGTPIRMRACVKQKIDAFAQYIAIHSIVVVGKYKQGVQRKDEQTDETARKTVEVCGECRRFPPVFINNLGHRCPPTGECFFCGEWMEKQDE